jgi:hypothetical protein
MDSRLARRRSFMMRGRPQPSVHRIQGLIDLVQPWRPLPGMRCLHAAAKATEATAPEATEAAPCRIARTPTHGYAATREAAMAAFAKS